MAAIGTLCIIRYRVFIFVMRKNILRQVPAFASSYKAHSNFYRKPLCPRTFSTTSAKSVLRFQATAIIVIKYSLKKSCVTDRQADSRKIKGRSDRQTEDRQTERTYKQTRVKRYSFISFRAVVQLNKI